MKKTLRKVLPVLALVLVVAVASVGGTIAWLTANTDPVVNTFTVGDINITLGEITTNFKMVPGNTIAKDPKVTVKAGSEDCWLFVKIDESTNLKDFITYTVADGWTKLQDGVYYREVSNSSSDQPFAVLKDNQVKVIDTVTKGQLEAVKDTNKPTLTFTAYAVQKDNVNSAADAWAKLNPTSGH